jgi:hypothetical protein
MPEGQPSQPVIIVASTKSTGLAIILALLFGPLGLLYSSVLAAVVMFIVSIPVVIFTAGFGLLLTQPICAVWAAVAVMSRNKKLVEGATGSLIAARRSGIVPDVAVSSPVPTEVPGPVQALPHPSNDSMFCEVCGTEDVEGHRFCGKCGGQLQAAVQNVEESQGAPEVLAPVPLIATETGPAQGAPGGVSSSTVALALAALVILAALGYWWMNRLPSQRTPSVGVTAVSPQPAVTTSTSSKIEAQQRKSATFIEGTISKFECGDSCYLTITDKNRKEYTGLCLASICNAWTALRTMPPGYKRKSVRATFDKGNQHVEAGDVVGTEDAFTRIEVL